MTLMRSAVTMILSVAAIAGCRQTAGPEQPTPSAEPAVAEPRQAVGSETEPPRSVSSTPPDAGPVVGHLETRDKLITIRSGSDGPVYTVKSEDGTVLAVNLPSEELSARFPELKDVVQGGIAVWAGMDLD